MATLVCHGGALGDFLTALPAIRVWRRLHPAGSLVLLGRPPHAALCPSLFGGAWDAGEPRFASLFGDAPDGRLAALVEQFDSALVFSPAGSGLAAALEALGVPAVVRQDPFPPRGADGRACAHVVDWHLSLFTADEVRGEERLPRVEVPSGGLTPLPGTAVRPGTVALAPGSGSPAKNWPLARWQELARALAARGRPVAWILGPAEEGVEAPRGVEAWAGLSLPVLAERLSRASQYVGNDSGVSHLAAAAGCPSLVLFGPTDPAEWAPRGPRVRILAAPGGALARIDVQDVLAAASGPAG